MAQNRTDEDLFALLNSAADDFDQLAHSVGVPPAMILAWEEDAAEVACPNALRQILQQSDERFIQPWPSSNHTN